VNIIATFFWWFFIQNMLLPFVFSWVRIGTWAVRNEKRHSEDEQDGDELFSMSMYGSMGD
jgi:hypothetical protein